MISGLLSLPNQPVGPAGTTSCLEGHHGAANLPVLVHANPPQGTKRRANVVAHVMQRSVRLVVATYMTKISCLSSNIRYIHHTINLRRPMYYRSWLFKDHILMLIARLNSKLPRPGTGVEIMAAIRSTMGSSQWKGNMRINPPN